MPTHSFPIAIISVSSPKGLPGNVSAHAHSRQDVAVKLSGLELNHWLSELILKCPSPFVLKEISLNPMVYNVPKTGFL